MLGADAALSSRGNLSLADGGVIAEWVYLGSDREDLQAPRARRFGVSAGVLLRRGEFVTDDLSEPVVLPIEGELDLHAFAPRDIPSVVTEYLRECRLSGVLEVRIVHGRGKGVQRAVVQRLLRTLPDVESWHEAPIEAGGWGATIAMLWPPISQGSP